MTASDYQRSRVPGPAVTLHGVLQYMGWNWKTATTVENEWGMELDLMRHPVGCIEHWVREALRWRLQQSIPQTRNDLGDRQGMVIDGQASFALVRSKRLDRKQKTFLSSNSGGLGGRQASNPGCMGGWKVEGVN